MSKTTRMGRPPKPASERLTKQVNVMLTKAEWRALLAVARKEGLTLSGLLMRPWRKGED
jgi:hypothetical protein